MKKLISEIKKLRPTIKTLVNGRIKEFESIGSSSTNRIFNELCFCILTANFNAKRGIEIQNKIKNGFCNLSKENLSIRLKEEGYRFPNTRADYIVKAREFKNKLRLLNNQSESREWLANNIKGLGYKESSHFLRNIGKKDFAIIDFHIIDLLEKFKVIKSPKTLTKAKYLEIEDKLRQIAEKSKLSLAELDLYLWYMETGKILK